MANARRLTKLRLSLEGAKELAGAAGGGVWAVLQAAGIVAAS